MKKNILLSSAILAINLISFVHNAQAIQLDSDYKTKASYVSKVATYTTLINTHYSDKFSTLSSESIGKVLSKITIAKTNYEKNINLKEEKQLKVLSLLDALENILENYISTETTLEKPHVILFMSDDQGFGQVGYNGHPDIKTPNFDAMADEGVQLNYFYSIAPICSPTRISIMTGLHPYRDKCLTVENCILQKATTTLPEILQENGYTTGHFGKWHIGKPNGPKASWPTNNGFEESYSHIMFFDMGENAFYDNGVGEKVNLTEDTSDFLVEKALDFIAENKDTPTFTLIWLPSPHNPYIALEKDKALYPEFSGDTQSLYAEINALDRSLGTLRKGIDEMGIKDNTLLWYNSDNGGLIKDDSFANGNLKGQKNSLNEGGIRVPAIIEYPTKFSTQKINTPISTLDIMPTVLDLAGIDIPSELDGNSVTSVLSGGKTSEPIYFWYDKNTTSVDSISDAEAVMIDFPYKLHREKKGGYKLYNIETDPNETANLSKKEKNVLESMIENLEEWQKSVLEDIEK